jgi:hypothetical protein
VPLLLVVAALAIRPRWVLPLLVLVVAFLAMPLLTRIHRHRLRATAGVVIEPQPFMPNGLNVAGIREAIRSPSTWRQVGYHFLVAPALAVALAPHEISVATVAPGFVETEMATDHLAGERGASIRAQSPFGRVARAQEVAAAVLYLASPEAAFASGAVLDLNGASYLRT